MQEVSGGEGGVHRTSTGWFDGFTRHLTIYDQREVVAYQFTPGHVDGRHPVREWSRGLAGPLFGDNGSGSQI